jgi:hypothetical protein
VALEHFGLFSRSSPYRRKLSVSLCARFRATSPEIKGTGLGLSS